MPTTHLDQQTENNFDALRLGLAVLVIFSHSFPLATGSGRNEPLLLLTRGQLSLGTLAVNGFFVISGYLITQSWHRSPGTASFIKKRVCRIYPGFVVAAAVCVWGVVPLANGRFGPIFRPDFLLYFAEHGLKLQLADSSQAFLANPYAAAVNGSLWTIPYEFWCYLAVAGLGLTQILGRRGVMLAMLCASIALHLYVCITGWTPTIRLPGALGEARFWIPLIPLYLAGVVFHLFRDRVRLQGRAALLALAGLAVAAAVPPAMAVALPTLGTYVLLYVAFSPRLKLHAITRCGDFSYGLYLYAFPIQQLIMQRVGHACSPYALFAMALPATLLAAALSWHAVERRFLARRRSPRSAGAPAACPPALLAASHLPATSAKDTRHAGRDPRPRANA